MLAQFSPPLEADSRGAEGQSSCVSSVPGESRAVEDPIGIHAQETGCSPVMCWSWRF